MHIRQQTKNLRDDIIFAKQPALVWFYPELMQYISYFHSLNYDIVFSPLASRNNPQYH